VKVITGIDLPYGTAGGSVELLHDLYLGTAPRIPSDCFMLAPAPGLAVPPGGPVVLPVDGKAVEGPRFWSYVDGLSAAIRARFPGDGYDVVHLQHLAFGATPALERAFPQLPRVALVHGTDLLYAEAHPVQAEVLRRTAGSAHAVVVPTTAMADRLARLVGSAGDRVVHIPWGVPDELLATGAGRRREPSGRLRILYAGRLTAEKVSPSMLTTLAGLDGVELSVAAPPTEYARMGAEHDLSAVRYAGWLARPALWREFERHDLLIVPSRTLEAFGLVAVEAQACGLPVACHAVPGLSEVLGDSALRVDFGSPGEVVALVERTRRMPGLLAEAREAGRRNSARFPLSATVSGLTELSARLIGGGPVHGR
jgi:glycosyltransferase involved in cell wall biosynthesis